MLSRTSGRRGDDLEVEHRDHVYMLEVVRNIAAQAYTQHFGQTDEVLRYHQLLNWASIPSYLILTMAISWERSMVFWREAHMVRLTVRWIAACDHL